MILLIDNYDSFSYNLYQLVGSLNPDIQVRRNDAKTTEGIAAMYPEGIIISPGPGRPRDAGICEDVVKELGTKIPLLGVCLGEQAICEAFGATIGYVKTLMHGKSSIATLDTASPLFKGLPKQIEVARYHSLAVEADTIPDCLKVTAVADDGEVMAVEHKELPIYGVQFHPESIMTPKGEEILKNFLDITRQAKQATVKD